MKNPDFSKGGRYLIFFMLIGSLLMTSCFPEKMFRREEAYIDMRDRMELIAGGLQKRTVAAKWQTVIHQPETDEFLYFPDNKVLVGTIDMRRKYRNSTELAPFNGPYYLIDSMTGKVLWSHERKGDLKYSYGVVATAPLFVYSRTDRKSTALVGLDMQSGTKVWEYKTTRNFRSAISRSAATLLVATSGNPPLFQAININDGRVLWSVKDKRVGALPVLEVDKDQIILGAASLSAYSIKDGSLKWSTSDGGAVASSAAILTASGGYLVPGINGMVSKINRKGKRLWQTAVGGSPGLMTASDKAVVAETTPKGVWSRRIVALSAKNGKKLWDREISPRAFSSLRFSGNRLIFTTEKTLEIWHAEKGKVEHSIALGTSGSGRLQDHLVVFTGHVVVAMENALYAFDVKSGKALWHYQLSGTNHMSYSWNSSVLNQSAPQLEDQVVKVIESSFDQARTMQQQTKRAISQAMQKRDNIYSQTRIYAQSKDYRDKAYASFMRQTATMHVENVAMINQSIDTAVSSINMALGVLTMGHAVEANAQAGANAAYHDRSVAKAILSPKVHMNAIYGNYYIRPFMWERGSGIIVVDMRRGSWAEISTAPAEDLLKDRIYLNVQLSIMANDGEQIITKGVGLDTSKWERDERYHIRSVHRSILSYNLSDLEMKPASEYKEKSITNWKSKKVLK